MSREDREIAYWREQYVMDTITLEEFEVHIENVLSRKPMVEVWVPPLRDPGKPSRM